MLLFIKKSAFDKEKKVIINSLSKNDKLVDIYNIGQGASLCQSLWNDGESYQLKIYLGGPSGSIIKKLLEGTSKLTEYLDYRSGCKPYEKGKGQPPQTQKIVNEKPFTSAVKVEPDWKRLIRGNDIQRYSLVFKKPEWIKYGKWLAAPREGLIFCGPRIVIQAIRNPSLKRRIIATYTEEEVIARINVYMLIKRNLPDIHYFYLLGIINSRLMNWFLMKDYGLHTYIITGLLNLPIKKINIENNHEKRLHDDLVALVNEILELNKKLNFIKNPSDLNKIKKEIELIDNKIDDKVFEIYELNNEEVEYIIQAPV